MQHLGGKMEKLAYARYREELGGAVTVEHRKGQPFYFAKLQEQLLPLVEQPPVPGLAGTPPPQRKLATPPPPSPTGPPGSRP